MITLPAIRWGEPYESIEPIGAHLAECRTHLIDADEAVDRRLARKDPSDMVEKRRDHLARCEKGETGAARAAITLAGGTG